MNGEKNRKQQMYIYIYIYIFYFYFFQISLRALRQTCTLFRVYPTLTGIGPSNPLTPNVIVWVQKMDVF